MKHSAKLAALQDRFASCPELTFESWGDELLMVRVHTVQMEATVSLQGAQLVHFQNPDEHPLLWRGVPSTFRTGKALRAGVPVCWPWFANHPLPGYPAHGIARINDWALEAAHSLPDGRFRLIFDFSRTGSDSLWPYACDAKLIMTLGSVLQLELVSINKSDAPVTISQALHTYFHVGDVRHVSVKGLGGYPYFSYGVSNPPDARGAVLSNFEAIERVYADPKGVCELIDPLLGRSIWISSTGSRSTVVWNPGLERANAMGDLGPNGHLSMLCVENANAPITGDAICIPPHESHTLAVQYRSVTNS